MLDKYNCPIDRNQADRKVEGCVGEELGWKGMVEKR